MAANFRQIPSKKGVAQINIDLEPVLTQLGALHALARSVHNVSYADALMDESFEYADEVFDRQADAIARVGAIPHMYEWGTVGVNRGKSNMRLPPENPKSKLWSNVAVGSGFNRDIVWVYRPSVATVPRPTVSDTGMSPDVIASLSPQYFTWKAEIMEEGHEVTISPKVSKFLLIPATKENIANYGDWFRTNDINRGYLLTKSTMEAQPGRMYAGTFTAVWDSFWLNTAPELMEVEISAMIQKDYFPEIYKERTPGKMIPAKAWSVRTQVAESAKTTEKRVTAKRRMKARAAAKKRAARKAKK